MSTSRPERMSFLGWIAAGCLVVWLAIAAGTTRAEGESEWRFIQGLRLRGYHDVTLRYLDQVKTSPRCPADLKEQIDYEAGKTLMAMARTSVRMEDREKLLDQAKERFAKFIDTFGSHRLAAEAGMQLANVLVERGRMKVDMANRPGKSAAEKSALLTEGRGMFTEALEVFKKAEQRARDAAALHQGVTYDPRKDADKIAERDAIRANLVQTRLYVASVTYEIGKTYPPKSKEYTTHLETAAAKYKDLFSKYGTFVGGLYARMWEGRTYKELGKTKEAVRIFEEMLTLPNDPPAFRSLKSQSRALLIETFMAPAQKQYAEALATATEWETQARPNEKSSPEGLNILLLGGRAAFEYAKALSKPEQEPQRKAAVKKAREFLGFVGRFPGPLRLDASKILADPLFGATATAAEEPDDYYAAKDRADIAWSGIAYAVARQKQVKTEAERKTLTAQLNKARDEATKYYNLALQLKGDDVSTDVINGIRFRMTFLYWLNEDYHRAILMGEFLARRYPSSSGARKGGEIAVKGYRTLYVQASQNKGLTETVKNRIRSFSRRRMEDLTTTVMAKWPDAKETQQAWMMLLDTSIDDGQLDAAAKYVENINPELPSRVQAELRLGQAIWVDYVKSSNLPEDQRPETAQLDAKVLAAQKMLETGVQRSVKNVENAEDADLGMLVSVLSLVQIYLGANEPDKAVTWLDHPKVGPMTLVTADAAVTHQGSIRVETLKCALRAYVGVQEIPKAEAAMAALEKEISADGDEDAIRRLTQEYIRLGKQLEELLVRLRNDRKHAEAAEVAKGFTAFLDQIRQKEQGNTFGSLNWVARTFHGMGTALDTGGSSVPPDAMEKYEKAMETYKAIYLGITNKTLEAPANAVANMTLRGAVLNRDMHSHEVALKAFVGLLTENERRLDVQIEAAENYQDWGLQRPDYFKKAIMGGHPKGADAPGQNLIWGWSVISRRVSGQTDPRFQDVYYRARYSMALCQFAYGMSLKDTTDRANMIQQAQLGITRLHSLHPTLGGEQWRAKFDVLLKRIQKIRSNKRATGLAGLEEEKEKEKEKEK